MDIREIQRLHAQFAPDSMVIDLPRQIAALPGPGELSAPEPSRAMQARLSGFAPRARQAAIALAVAAMVAMAGMGAASLYKNVQAHRPIPAAAAGAVTSPKSDAPIAAAAKPDTPVYREVDATPARPVSVAPALSASDFASARSLGLTADQFRDSLKAPARVIQATGASAAPALTGEAQLAAVSPIHRAGSGREAAPSTTQPAATAQATAVQAPAAPTPAAPAVQAPAANPSAQAAPAAPPAPAAATPTQQPAETVKPAHAARHHISRPRTESADSNTDARPPVESRTGSAEVKMF